ncbi:DUF2306 domain-containing protein [Hoyosella altamirensis]|uniref:DUF2306 domain-containing protein n=1 Tax=Hoyosella altamirensis TaxID=616997 RepID=A0A839RJ83_9ACTN|nr:DUF2306 domain-containing protein [Hoyosella altamirensis]MBB3036510.1 hypothetical protein [Hoyosella altamirensis]
MKNKQVRTAMWIGLALLCVVYGPMAIEYMLRFFTPNAPSLWDTTFSSVVGDEIVYGEGSIHLDQQAAYENSLGWLLVHTIGGGLAILLGITQFSQRFRTRYLHIHRRIGRAQVTIVIISMIAASGYLIRTGPDDTFSGPAFYLQLWALVIATLTTSILAVIAIVRGHVRTHQTLMAVNFALLLSAPLLRIGYLLFGLAWPDATHDIINVASGTVVPIVLFLGAVFAIRASDTRRISKINQPIAVPPWVRGTIYASAVVAFIPLFVAVSSYIGGIDRLLAAHLVTYVLALIVVAAMGRQAQRDGDVIGAAEWKVIHLGLAAAPAAFVVLWAVYTIPFTVSEAFYGATLTAAAVTLFVAYGVVAWNRRVIKPAGTGSAAQQPVMRS